MLCDKMKFLNKDTEQDTSLSKETRTDQPLALPYHTVIS